jgi:hypothetical protein
MNGFANQQPIEEQDDTESERWEMHNLADLRRYPESLARLPEATQQWQQKIGDTGMIPCDFEDRR